MENFNNIWFALCSDGAMVNLGYHEEIDEADETASNLGYDVIWLVSGEDAAAWADTINSQRKEI